MESEPTFQPVLNRTAIEVRHREPFINWLTSIDPENAHIDLEEDLNCYLVPTFEEFDDLQDYLISQYDNIFKSELHDWYTDQDLWPEQRTFQMFQEWFDLRVHVTVFDLVNEPPTRSSQP